MAAVTHAGTGTWTTTAGNKTAAATPAAGDLIVVIAASTGVATTAVTDSNADGLGAYTQADSTRTGFSTSGNLTVWVRNALVGSATSTTWTATQASSTGGGLDVFRVSGMSFTGARAVRGSGGQSAGTTGTTPAPVLSLTPLTANPVIGAVCNGQTVAGSVITQRTGYTESSDLAYSTPGTGLETMFLASGETTATITWGGTSGSAFASVAVELDSAAAETSPALEASGFGSFTGIAATDTILSVTATVNQWSSVTAMAAPVYELWDGTSAQIGADVTGSVSTSTAHTDTATWTGLVSYSQLATLRLRVTGHQGNASAGDVQSADWAGLSVLYLPVRSGAAAVATGTAAALNPSVPAAGVAAGLASGAGSARPPVPAIGVTAAAATGAGAAQNPSAATGVTPGAGLASGAGAAQGPAPAIGVTAVAATGAGTALNPAAVSAAAVTAGLAPGTGAAQNPAPAIGVTAVAASGAGTAQNPAVSTTASGTGSAGLAPGTGAALNPSAATGVTPGAVLAAGTGAAAAAPAIGVRAGLASGAATALNPAASTAPSAQANAAVAAGTGAALNPAAAIGVTPGAVLAGGTSSAASLAALAAAQARAVLAAGTGAGLGASCPLGTVKGTSAASVSQPMASAAGVSQPSASTAAVTAGATSSAGVS